MSYYVIFLEGAKLEAEGEAVAEADIEAHTEEFIGETPKSKSEAGVKAEAMADVEAESE